MKSILVLLVAVLALGACGSGTAVDDEAASNATGVVHRFVIPAGTGDSIDRGETVEVMPDHLDIKVGDAIEIVNEDDRGHNIGLFFVGEGETVNQVFPSVAEFADACSVSASGQFSISVT